MVNDFTMADVHRLDSVHVFLRQGKIKHIKVLLNAFFTNRLRDNNYTSLNIPTKSYLRRGFAVLFADAGQYRMIKEIMQALIERTPSFRHHIVLFHRFQIQFLLEERMHFHLINHRLDFKGFAKIGQYLRIAVRHADSFKLTFFI